MPTLRLTTAIDVPARTVAGALRDAELVQEAYQRCGRSVTAAVRLLSVGDELREVPDKILRVAAVGVTSMVIRGDGLLHTTTLTPSPVGTTVLDEIDGADGPEDDVRDLLLARATELTRRAKALAAAPVVVATALVRGGTVLAARRTRPAALAGRWELPGGRVEAGESEAEAVVRECREELGTTVVPGERLGTDLPIDVGVLRVHTAGLADGASEPRTLEHSALRWVEVCEVASLDWVDADRAVVDDLVGLLGVGLRGQHGVPNGKLGG